MPINYTQYDPDAFFKGAEFVRQGQQEENQLQRLYKQDQRVAAADDRAKVLQGREDQQYKQESEAADREKVLKYLPFAQSALQSGDPRAYVAAALSDPRTGQMLRADGVFDDEDLTDPELPQHLQAFIGLAGPQKPVDPGPMEQIVGPDGKPVFAPRSQAAGKQPYYKPDAATAAEKPQLVDVQMPDGSTQKQWVAPGRTSGPAVGAPKPTVTQAGKPLPIGALRLVDDAKQALGSIGQSQTIIDSAINTLNSGKVNLGLLGNAVARGKNVAGMSSEASRAYSTVIQSFEKLRANYLLLAKGVQTEGDAKRAWDAEIGRSAQNDNKLARQQLEKARSLIEEMANMQQGRIATVYGNYGIDPPEAVPTQQPAAGGWSVKRVK